VRAWAPSRGPRILEDDGVVSVPSLSASEGSQLRSGVLPSGSAAGDALGWIARDLCGLKVGLALGGGSAKGYAHLGAMQVLMDSSLPIDYLSGTSIGAAAAGFYALGFNMADAAVEMDRLGSRAFRPHLSMRSLLSSRSLRRGMKTLCGDRRIEDLPVPLALTAADISSGHEVVFRHGLLWPAVLASMAIPGVFPAQRIGDHTLVDGGVFHPLPSNIVAAMGADIVIGIRLMSTMEARTEAEAVEPSGRAPSIFATIMRSIELMQGRIAADTASTATILITPMETEVEFERIGLRRWKSARQYIALGEAAAEAALPRLAAALPWMRG
jgi:NTE family protein